VQGDTELRWKRVDQSDFLAHFQEKDSLYLVYGRTYTVGVGYSYSETNNLISNLKISPDELHRLKYKNIAINRFIEEVKAFFSDAIKPDNNITLPTFQIIPIPPSKCRANPKYDDRMEQVASGIADLNFANYFPVLETKNDSLASHLSSDSRDPSIIYDNMVVNTNLLGNYSSGDILVLLDDVLTSGAHLSAALRHLRETFDKPNVMGIFWAKSQNTSDFQ
jgi:hypothetical protein